MPVVITDEVASNITVSTAATQEVALDVIAHVEVIPETVSKTTHTTSEPNVVVVVGLGTGAISSPPVMMPGVATPPRSLIIGLISTPKTLSLCIFLLFIFM